MPPITCVGFKALHSNKSIWLSVVRTTTVLTLVAPMVAACGFGGNGLPSSGVKRGAFSSKEYGVGVSPRVTTDPNPPKGGGRYQVGKPYTVKGKTYVPAEQPDYVATGKASWYGWDFHGRRTANGEIFSANAITAAHPTLPLPSYVRVTNLENGRSVIVRVNDRGPYVAGRIIDLSQRAADLLEYRANGSTSVEVDYVGPAPLEGDDTRFLMASLNQPTPMENGGTRFAMFDAGQGQAADEILQVASNSEQPIDYVGQHTDRQVVPVSRGSFSGNDLASMFSGIFSYADPVQGDIAINDAHAAANAMATRSPDLAAWAETIDQNALKIDLSLGVFGNPDGATRVATEFALLGAVDEQTLMINGKPAMRLTLTHLKPGVARTDVLDLARELGLNDIVLY